MKRLEIVLVLSTLFVAVGVRAKDYADVIRETPGLVAYWRFEETIDPRLQPEKGKKFDVDVEATKGLFFPGGATLKLSARVHDAKDDYVGRTEEVTTGEKGLSGKAFRFNGKDSVVYIFRDPGLESGTGDFSIELWLRPDNTQAAFGLLHRMSPFEKSYAGIHLYTAPGGSLTFSVLISQNRRLDANAPEGTIVPARWQHIVALRQGAAIKIYVDGKLVREETGILGLRIPDYGDVIIGRMPWDRPFLGLIDEVAYYNVALSAEQIEKHFLAGGVGR